MTDFSENFNEGSFLPLLLVILGTYNIYLFMNGEFAKGFLVMLFSFITYVSNNLILEINNKDSLFNEYLEELASFLSFGLTTIAFGFVAYKKNLIILGVIILYTINIILNEARNWTLPNKNSKGWPIPMNGIFFPLIYYLTKLYFNNFNLVVFIIFYIFIAFVSISDYTIFKFKE